MKGYIYLIEVVEQKTTIQELDTPWKCVEIAYCEDLNSVSVLLWSRNVNPEKFWNYWITVIPVEQEENMTNEIEFALPEYQVSMEKEIEIFDELRELDYSTDWDLSNEEGLQEERDPWEINHSLRNVIYGDDDEENF